METHILLGSNSPRRRELLELIAPGFTVATPKDVDESYPADLCACEVPEYLSRLKAGAYTDSLHDNEILVTADTVVILEGRILGKPHSHDEAVEMLKSLSGRSHEVMTGVTLTSTRGSVSFSETTVVEFDSLSDSEIIKYVDEYKPYDKAGAYGIQEWIGCIGIRGIHGCFYNVMGLPLHSLYRHLKDFPG